MSTPFNEFDNDRSLDDEDYLCNSEPKVVIIGEIVAILSILAFFIIGWFFFS